MTYSQSSIASETPKKNLSRTGQGMRNPGDGLADGCEGEAVVGAHG